MLEESRRGVDDQANEQSFHAGRVSALEEILQYLQEASK